MFSGAPPLVSYANMMVVFLQWTGMFGSPASADAMRASDLRGSTLSLSVVHKEVLLKFLNLLKAEQSNI